MVTFSQFLENTNVKPNELRAGDKVSNCNKECEHYRSTGKVLRVIKLVDKDNVVGNEVEYECDCDGPTWKRGDRLKKTEIQLKKV